MKNGGMKLNTPLKASAYQIVPLLKILHNNLNSILICDGVGVGKTISAGYILLYLITQSKRPGIVICPPSLLLKWKGELESKFDLRVSIVSHDEEIATMENELESNIKHRIATVYILPSSILGKLSISDKMKSSVIVFDEIHNFRNKETIGFKNACEIASKAEYRVGLSATPINNSLDDFISELSILLNSSWDVVSMMIDDLWQRKKMVITNSMVTRFTKENLGLHFAKRQINSFQIEYPISYVEKIKNLISKIPSSKNDFFEKVTYYRLAASSSKAFSKSMGLSEDIIDVDPKISKLSQILQKKKHSRWIIFCEFTETVNILIKKLSENWQIFSMTGDTPLFVRQETIDDFRNSKNSILIMSSVGSEGLDIQFCDALINYDLHWNPMKIEQRIGRIDRIGQKKDKITVVNMIVSGSIDQRILEVIERKLSLISNSVFNLPPLIHKHNKNKIEMFDQKILEQESKTTENFLNSVKNWSTLPLEDYSIISKIDQKHCSINELKINAKANNKNFFKKITEFKKWRKIFDSNSLDIKKRMTLYS